MPSIDAVLRAVAPQASPAFIAASAKVDVGGIMLRYGITTPTGQAQVIGQMAHECGFAKFEENLNYSAERLHTVWPKRFPTIAAAQPYAHNPRALANNVYGARMGNRPGTNDGYDFRGSGGMQHTGSSEFDRVTRRVGADVKAHPALLRGPSSADVIWAAACSFIADKPGALAAVNAGDTNTATLKINGGTNGLADRKILVSRATKAMAGKTIELTVTAAPAGKVVITEKTTAEDADDKKRTATKGTIAAPAGGTVTGGAAKKGADFDWASAIGIGLGIAVLIGVVAVVLWRSYGRANAKLEAMQLENIKARAELVAA